MRTTPPLAGFAFCFAALAAQSEAHAKDCAPPTPECHLANGSKLLDSDPKRAAKELLASFQLDERTDTLTLYATALQRDKQYARALDTWQRIILFRESEIEAAKEALRTKSSRKRDAARAAEARAQEQSEQAAAEIMTLWTQVGRVRIVFAPGQQYVVTDDGIEIDATKEFLVNAGRDELTFTRPDGSVERVVVEVASGQLKTIEAPKARAEAPVVTQPAAPAAPVETTPVSVIKTPKPALSTTRYVETERSPIVSRIGLTVVAGGVVGFGVAATLGYLADRDFDDAQDLGCSAQGSCPVGSAADLAERSNDRARFAQISAVAGGALIVTGATMWLLGRGKTRRAATDVSVSLTPSSVGIGWSLK